MSAAAGPSPDFAERPPLNEADRLFWVSISELCVEWRSWLLVVQPDTVVGWHRNLFRAFWTWKIRQGRAGRPGIPKGIRELIRRMSRENPTWGGRQFHGELLKLGIEVVESTVRVPGSAGRWLRQILDGGPRPEAFRWQMGPHVLLRDRDRIFGQAFVEQVEAFGIRQVLSPPHSPWQRAHVERVIGAIRRECLDRVVVFGEPDLRRWLSAFVDHYHQTRTDLALGKDAPEAPPVQSRDKGSVIAYPKSVACIISTNAAPPELVERAQLLPAMCSAYR